MLNLRWGKSTQTSSDVKHDERTLFCSSWFNNVEQQMTAEWPRSETKVKEILAAKNHFRLTPEHAVDGFFLRQRHDSSKKRKNIYFVLKLKSKKLCDSKHFSSLWFDSKGSAFHEKLFRVFVCCVTDENAILGERSVILLFMWENVFCLDIGLCRCELLSKTSTWDLWECFL